MSPWTDRTAVVTGANRGLGLGFVRHLARAAGRVFALCREPDRAEALAALAARHGGRVTVVGCDVTDDASVARAFEGVAAAAGTVDLLINNAGVFGPRNDSLETLDFDALRAVFEVNVIGTLRVTRAALPVLGGPSPRVIVLSSLMGSIADNQSGDAWAYRLSKAALNMATRNLGHELIGRGIVAAALHPGWVRTDMGGAGAPLEVDEAVAAMLGTIALLGPDASGMFVDRDGQPLSW